MERDFELQYTIDVEPIYNHENEKKNIPLYDVDYDYTRSNSPENVRRKPKSSFVCWNCSEEGHNLQSCPMPRNQSEITKNRKAFMESSKRRGDRNLAKRYHEQYEQKYAKFKPGKLSKKLRDALGLKANQLPRHIYRMRSLGYPPGWLKEAQVLPSSIQMYDGTGERVPDPEDEEGEIESEHIKYNLDMIVDYPGFNTQPEPDYLEEAEILRFPYMNENDQKKNMIAHLQFVMKRNGNLAENPDKKVKEDDGNVSENELINMEAEDITEETIILPEDEKCGFVPPLPTGDLPPPPPEDVPEMNVPETPKREVESGEEASKNPGSVESSPYDRLGQIKSVYYGTPVVKGASPYSKLPSYDKFREGMGEVLTFENLPNSTGTYDRLCVVLNRVRSAQAAKK